MRLRDASALAVVLAVLVTAAADGVEQTPAAPVPPANATSADLQLPEGFRFSVFAENLPGARFMAVSPEGVLLLARRRTHEVVALPDADGDGRATPSVILTGMTNAHSLAFRQGYLYVATTPAVMRVRWANGAPVGDPERFVDLPTSTPSVHASRTIGFDGDGTLYVSIGSSCDVCVEPDARRTTIQAFGPDGAPRGAFAVGLRNATGFDWDPATGRMWAGDNAQDRSGADFPPDELNLVERGKHYGFPFFVGRNVPNRAPEIDGVQATVAANDAVPPALELPAHAAVADVRFYRGTQFPAAYRGALFVSLHGATAIPEKVGYKVVRVVMKVGRPVGVEDFVTGWVKSGVVTGRPAGLATGADGALYVSDDNKGFIYRIHYRQP